MRIEKFYNPMCQIRASYLHRYMHMLMHVLVLCSIIVTLSSCGHLYNASQNRFGDHLDKDLQMNREDFRDALLPMPDEKSDDEEPAIPEVSNILTAPKPPSFGTEKLVSLSVTEDVPLKDVLIELGRLADVDMELDPSISGGIILRVKDKPFKDVIERVTRLGGLRYENNGGILRIERDLPYLKNYSVDFLNLVRSGSGGISVNTQVLGGTTDEGLSGGSNNAITSSYEGDVWESIESSIESILAHQPGTLSVATEGETIAAEDNSTSFIINKPAGVINVLATERQHRNIDSYLESVRKQVSAQVLIEAKIVEVTLDEDYRTGIDWGVLEDSEIGLKVTGGLTDFSSAQNLFTISGAENITSALSMIDEFGVSRTLSNPRIHAMHNQQAVLTFAENAVYFTLQVEEQTDGSGSDAVETLTIESTLNTVPVGVIITMQPSINIDTQEVTMNIRPTLSRITDTVNDPGVDIIVARSDEADPDLVSEIPVIEVRELDSVMKIKSGDVMVMGGLMTEANVNQDKGVPYASRIPILGNAFKSVVKTSQVVETVIFIRATIVGTDQYVPEADKRLYKKFMKRDPHPIAF